MKNYFHPTQTVFRLILCNELQMTTVWLKIIVSQGFSPCCFFWSPEMVTQGSFSTPFFRNFSIFFWEYWNFEHMDFVSIPFIFMLFQNSRNNWRVIGDLNMTLGRSRIIVEIDSVYYADIIKKVLKWYNVEITGILTFLRCICFFKMKIHLN